MEDESQMGKELDLRSLFVRFLAEMNGIGELDEASFTTSAEVWQNDIKIGVHGHDGRYYTLTLGSEGTQNEVV